MHPFWSNSTLIDKIITENIEYVNSQVSPSPKVSTPPHLKTKSSRVNGSAVSTNGFTKKNLSNSGLIDNIITSGLEHIQNQVEFAKERREWTTIDPNGQDSIETFDPVKQAFLNRIGFQKHTEKDIDTQKRQETRLLLPVDKELQDIQYKTYNPRKQYYRNHFKRLAHAFSMKKTIVLRNEEIRLEGFSDLDMETAMTSAFLRFAKEHSLSSHFENWIKSVFLNSLSEFDLSDSKIEKTHHNIHDKANPIPTKIASGYNSHANKTIIYNNFLIICDRGGTATEPGILIYKIINNDFLTKNYIKELANPKGATGLNNLVSNIQGSSPAELENLGIEKFVKIPMKRQKAGNCTYASFKLSLRALFAIYYLQMNKRIQTDPESWKDAFAHTKQIYKAFCHFDRENLVESFLQFIKTEKNPDFRNTMKEMATLLVDKDTKSKKFTDKQKIELLDFVLESTPEQ